MCCNKNKQCGGCDPCNKCKAQPEYCGEDLICLDIRDGDTYGEVLRKINSVVCKDPEDYTFEENPICENGGIIVRNKAQEVVFSQCYPQGGSGTNYTFEEKEECENGGIIVKDSNESIVFEQCYPCCNIDCSELDFTNTQVWIPGTPHFNINTSVTGGSGNYSYYWTYGMDETLIPPEIIITGFQTDTLRVEAGDLKAFMLFNLKVVDEDTKCIINKAYFFQIQTQQGRT